MKQTINFSQFCDAFIRMDRKDQFSYDAKKALFKYYEQLEQDTGEEIELDVIAICCEWAESTVEEALSNYSNSCEDLNDLENSTTVIDLGGGDILYIQF